MTILDTDGTPRSKRSLAAEVASIGNDDFDVCIECEAFAEDGNIKHKAKCSAAVEKRALAAKRRGPKTTTTKPERKPATRTKDLKAPTDKELGRIAVDLFNGKTTMTKTAKALGISASYLSRLLKQAEKRGAYRYSVAR